MPPHAGLGGRVRVCRSKIEELHGIEPVDVLVSEPMGTLLVNERMLETYLYARDHFLKPGGRMFPVRLSCLALVHQPSPRPELAKALSFGVLPRE